MGLWCCLRRVENGSCDVEMMTWKKHPIDVYMRDGEWAGFHTSPAYWHDGHHIIWILEGCYVGFHALSQSNLYAPKGWVWV